MTSDIFSEIFGYSMKNTMGYKSDNTMGYYCIKCKNEMVAVKILTELPSQKMFFCPNKKCNKFGDVTVVAVQKKK